MADTVPYSTLADLGLREREHLQEWILRHPQLLGPGVDIVTSEFDRWEDARGEPVRDRLDVLGIDREGRLIVVELKGGHAPHTIHMQAINYAAMVGRLSPRDVAELWVHYRSAGGPIQDVDSVLTELETERLLSVESVRSPRIVLVATNFPAKVTAPSYGSANRESTFRSFAFHRTGFSAGKKLVTFARIRMHPIPSIEDFTIGCRLAPASDSLADESALPGMQLHFGGWAEQGNEATLAMMDLCAADDADGVTVSDTAHHADISVDQVKGNSLDSRCGSGTRATGSRSASGLLNCGRYRIV